LAAQHRSDNGGYADAEHVSMRREHDHELATPGTMAPANATAPRNTRRIAAGLLMGELAPATLSRKTTDASDHCTRFPPPPGQGSGVASG